MTLSIMPASNPRDLTLGVHVSVSIRFRTVSMHFRFFSLSHISQSFHFGTIGTILARVQTLQPSHQPAR